MNGFQNILIVDDEKNFQQIIALLFKRSLSGLPNSSLTITYASSLTEAKNYLSKQQFTIITLDGELPCFVDGGFGYRLIPFIKDFQKENPKIIMISGEKRFITKGLNLGADFGFHKQDIMKHVKLNEKFELISQESLV